jgi:hypothetical protein
MGCFWWVGGWLSGTGIVCFFPGLPLSCRNGRQKLYCLLGGIPQSVQKYMGVNQQGEMKNVESIILSNVVFQRLSLILMNRLIVV